jgi:hypothetical protein
MLLRLSWWFDLFLTKLVDKYRRKIHRKNYDDCFINRGDISSFGKRLRNREEL